jgi:hypothetical protein
VNPAVGVWWYTLQRGVEILNHLTFKEYVSLVATYFIQSDASFNCDQCLGMYPGREGRDQVIDQTRSRKYCWGVQPGDEKSGFTIGEMKFRICPGHFYSHEAALWIQTWFAYRLGSMPFDGGLMDQPAKMMEILDLLNGLDKQSRDRSGNR